MRRPGSLLLRLADVLGLTRLRDTVLLPAVADMQHECGEAGSGARRTWTLLRGYWAILSGCAFYATQLPWRHLREHWVGSGAPGPRLLRMAWPTMMAMLALGLGIILAIWPEDTWKRGVSVVALMLPGLLMMLTPLALGVGVGWVLARDRSPARAAVAVGMVASGLSFAFYDLVVTRTHETRVVTGQGDASRKGNLEMTFHELDVAIARAGDRGQAGSPERCSCSQNKGLTILRTEWHKRLSIPALALSFVILAAGLSRSGRRAIVVPAVWLAYLATITCLRFAIPSGIQGDVPVALAAWIPHLVPLGLAALLSKRVTPGDRGSVLADDSPLRP